jgi:hypothetical protein
MNRDMRKANQALFANAERFCQRRSEPIPTAGRRRYVSVRKDEEGDQDRRDLTRGTIEATVRFGGERSLAHVRVDADDYIGLIGFDHEPVVSSLSLIDVTPGLMILLLSEMSPRPRATPAEIRNVVEVGSMDDGDYAGHTVASVGSLFPRLQLLTSDQPIDQDSAQRLFLMISAVECAHGASWIEDALAEELVSLTALDVPALPYAAIGESMFDADPRSLYMALYRCIEATYAYDTSRRLVDELKLSVPWVEMAEALANVAGWRPQEASSLNIVLGDALEQDLREVCQCLNVSGGKDLAVSAGKAIYSVRNRIVHYRPGTERVQLESAAWNKLCHLLVRIVFHVFTKAYP